MIEITIRADEISDAIAAVLAIGELSGSRPLPPPTVDSAVSADASPAQRFTVADGIVTDSATGLQWSQDDVADEALPWAKADVACKAYRGGGFDDWRLPSRAELASLVDATRHDPAIDTAAFPSCKSAWYWTATPYAASPSDCAWVVSFYGGDVSYDGRDDLSRVRAVRGSARQFLAV